MGYNMEWKNLSEEAKGIIEWIVVLLQIGNK